MHDSQISSRRRVRSHADVASGGSQPHTVTIPSFRALTPERWDDLELLFGAKGACDGCWCMWFRLSGTRFHAGVGAPNRIALRQLVRERVPTGLIAYEGDKPVGWCAVAPRASLPRLQRSPLVGAADCTGKATEPVWAITCFYVPITGRGQGVTRVLLRAAIKHAWAAGAGAIEAYPRDPQVAPVSAGRAYVGLLPMFTSEGFAEVTRSSPARVIVRLLRPPNSGREDRVATR